MDSWLLISTLDVTDSGPQSRSLNLRIIKTGSADTPLLSFLLLMFVSMLLTLVLWSSISPTKLPLKSSKQKRLFAARRTLDQSLQAHLGHAESRSMETTIVGHGMPVCTNRRWMQMDSTGLSTERLTNMVSLASQ